MFYLGYIDPGAGSLLLQMIAAGALGAVAFFRTTIFGFFRSKPKGEETPENEPEETTPSSTRSE